MLARCRRVTVCAKTSKGTSSVGKEKALGGAAWDRSADSLRHCLPGFAGRSIQSVVIIVVDLSAEERERKRSTSRLVS